MKISSTLKSICFMWRQWSYGHFVIVYNCLLQGISTASYDIVKKGQDIDSGTSAEIGYTYANGKPIIAISACERRYRNLFVEGMIIKTVNDVDEIVPTIKKLTF